MSLVLAPVTLRWQKAEAIDLRQVDGGKLLVANSAGFLAVANMLVRETNGLHAYLETAETWDYQCSDVVLMARLDGVFGAPLTRAQEAAEVAAGRC